MAEAMELQKLQQQATAEPEKFEHWEQLITALEAQEGGLNRNSSPQAIAATRDAYDRFLAQFPLFFGYWKKYADLEFQIAGTEAAEMVYERGVASIGVSVDLWTNYCAFKIETCHDADVIRELFERAAESCGLDFHAHIFWDKYIEFEERVESPEHIFQILTQVIEIPLHAYARYFERYRNMATQRPIDELAPPKAIEMLRNEMINEGMGKGSPADQETNLRARIDARHFQIFERTQGEVSRRWPFEQEIKRPYYHVTELDEVQLANWRKYLDFEQAEKANYVRTKFLFERCLVTCANYVEFWLRYARWMQVQGMMGNRNEIVCREEVRNIFRRACALFVPISQPEIRLHYAYYEESLDRRDVATDIHQSVLMHMPSHLDTMRSMVNTYRRSDNLKNSLSILQDLIDNVRDHSSLKGALVAEQARIMWVIDGDIEGARKIFEGNQAQVLDSESFWAGFLNFEISLPTSRKEEPHRYNYVRRVINDIRGKSGLSPEAIAGLVQTYMGYLQERGGLEAMREWTELDAEIHATDKSLKGTEGPPGGRGADSNGNS